MDEVSGPTAFLGGAEDGRSAPALVESLPRGPRWCGDPSTAVGEPELAAVIAEFLD